MPELGRLIWLTDEAEPERDAVGLTSVMLSCDRMAYRYAVSWAPSLQSWRDVRSQITDDYREWLESYGKPETWWVSSLPLRAVLSPVSG